MADTPSGALGADNGGNNDKSNGICDVDNAKIPANTRKSPGVAEPNLKKDYAKNGGCF